LEQNSVGSTGVSLSSIGLGGVFHGGLLDQKESFRILDYALGKGITYLDTAESYVDGMSERVIGNWMHQRGCRDKITVLTKFVRDDPGWGKREYIQNALEASLARLRTDYVDIYLMHFPDLTVPIEETLSTLTEEMESGKVRSIGLSNCTALQLQEALDTSASGGYQRFAVLQPEYSLAMPQYAYSEAPPFLNLPGLYEIEDGVFPICQREKIATTTWAPLAGGFLSGQYALGAPPPEGSRATQSSRFVDRTLTERNFQILDKLYAKAGELGMSIYNLAMAWAMTHPAVTSTIIGARRPEHIDNALEASEICLDPDLRAEMTSWSR
jgi:aryl-alcohol dehydrogenase-like predicted oxidoreductase